jgi:hypothetical protein
LRKTTEKFNTCDLILKSSAWVGAVPFMKRENQIEEVKKTNCYYWDTAVTSYTEYSTQHSCQYIK